MDGATSDPPRTLLLVHGAGSGPWVYDGWSQHFAGLNVATVDLQHGLDVASATHADYASAVTQAAASLPGPVCLCGWSMGGLVVAEAAERVRPHSVVLLEPSPPAEIQGNHPDVGLEAGTFDPEARTAPSRPGCPPVPSPRGRAPNESAGSPSHESAARHWSSTATRSAMSGGEPWRDATAAPNWTSPVSTTGDSFAIQQFRGRYVTGWASVQRRPSRPAAAVSRATTRGSRRARWCRRHRAGWEAA
jgi:pimeloyl-ACP methyl ester carboxylesterase